MRWHFFQMAVMILIGWMMIAADAADNGLVVGLFAAGCAYIATGALAWLLDLPAKLRRRAGDQE